MTHPRTIAVLGGGYAGLFAARRAAWATAKERPSAVRVVLIDTDDAWQERTRWHQLAAGETVRSRSRTRMFRGAGVESITATAAGIELDRVSSGQLGHELPEKARPYIRRALGRLGVEIMEECRVTAVEPGRARCDSGELKADLVIWTAGFTPSGLARDAGLEVNTTGQVKVDTTLRSVSHPFVFAAGDGAAIPRATSRYGAYAATATGATAGRNAARDLSGQAPAPLNMGYSFIAVSVGRHNAVVQLLRPDGAPRRQMLTGRPAHWIKEAIEHYVTFAARAESVLPGIYHWAPAARK